MSAFLTSRITPALATAACALALFLAACAPAATPTPTTAPTSAPAPTEAVADEPTEMVEEPTEAADDEADATEAADMDADATEAAGDDTAASASGDSEPGVVGVTSTRVREEPTVRGNVLVEIVEGTEVVALGETANAGYLFIRLEDGTEGWVSKQTINLEDRFADLPIIDP